APGALVEADHHVLAGILQVERVRVALAPVADDGDLLALDQSEVRVLVVVDPCRHSSLVISPVGARASAPPPPRGSGRRTPAGPPLFLISVGEADDARVLRLRRPPPLLRHPLHPPPGRA